MRPSLPTFFLFLSFSCFGQRLFDPNLVLTIPAAAGSTWSPTNTDSSGPAIGWWRVGVVADGYYTTNTGVAILTDLTGNGFHLKCSDSDSKKPSRQVGTINGQDTLAFINAKSSFLTNNSTSLDYAQPLDVFMVASITNANAAVRRYHFATTNTSAQFGMSLFVNGTGFEANAGSLAGEAAPITTNRYIVFDQIFNNASSTLRTNNVPSATVTLGVNHLSGVVLGARYDITAWAEMSFAEAFVFTNMTASDRTNAYNYLTNRYAIAP